MSPTDSPRPEPGRIPPVSADSTRGQRAAARVTAGAALLLGLTAWVVGPPGATAVVALAGLGVAFGWGRMLDLPATQGTRWVLLVPVVLGVLATVLSQLDDQALAHSVWWALPPAGGVLAALTHQVARSDGRPRVVDLLTAEVFAVIVVVAGFLWTWGGPAPAVTAAAGVAGTAIVDAVRPHRLLLAWAVGVLLGSTVALTWWVVAGSGPAGATLAAVGVLAPTISQSTRLVILRLPAVHSGVAGGVVAGLVSTLLAGIVTGLFATVTSP